MHRFWGPWPRAVLPSHPSCSGPPAHPPAAPSSVRCAAAAFMPLCMALHILAVLHMPKAASAPPAICMREACRHCCRPPSAGCIALWGCALQAAAYTGVGCIQTLTHWVLCLQGPDGRGGRTKVLMPSSQVGGTAKTQRVSWHTSCPALPCERWAVTVGKSGNLCELASYCFADVVVVGTSEARAGTGSHAAGAAHQAPQGPLGPGWWRNYHPALL
jgi:hypothetical protein